MGFTTSNLLTRPQNEMLKKTLRLWVACRFIESKWRCWSESGWADSDIRAMNPQDPFHNDLDSLPPYIDYQIASVIIQRILGPLRKDVLRDLQKTFNTHSPRDWFATFLTSFILLQNYEMQSLFQRQFAERRRAKVQYLDMPLVRATNSGAKTILAHFHYCYKGQQLFTPGFDWSAPRVRRMAKLDAEQIAFMAQCRDIVVKKGVFLFLSLPRYSARGSDLNSPDVSEDQQHGYVPREVVVHQPAVRPRLESAQHPRACPTSRAPERGLMVLFSSWRRPNQSVPVVVWAPTPHRWLDNFTAALATAPTSCILFYSSQQRTRAAALVNLCPPMGTIPLENGDTQSQPETRHAARWPSIRQRLPYSPCACFLSHHLITLRFLAAPAARQH